VRQEKRLAKQAKVNTIYCL